MAQHNGDPRIGAEAARIPGSMAHTGADGNKVGIRRMGRVAEITLTSSNEYATIELYDSLVQSMRNGSLRFEVKLMQD